MRGENIHCRDDCGEGIERQGESVSWKSRGGGKGWFKQGFPVQNADLLSGSGDFSRVNGHSAVGNGHLLLRMGYWVVGNGLTAG